MPRSNRVAPAVATRCRNGRSDSPGGTTGTTWPDGAAASAAGGDGGAAATTAGGVSAAAITTEPGTAHCGPFASAGVTVRAVAAARIQRIELDPLRVAASSRAAVRTERSEKAWMPAPCVASREVRVLQKLCHLTQQITSQALRPWIAWRQDFFEPPQGRGTCPESRHAFRISPAADQKAPSRDERGRSRSKSCRSARQPPSDRENVSKAAAGSLARPSDGIVVFRQKPRLPRVAGDDAFAIVQDRLRAGPRSRLS